jgi:6-phospho-3-hexuloisomerase
MTMPSVKEIAGQIGEEVGRCLSGVGEESLERAVSLLRPAKRVFLAGAGRSGLAARAFAMRLMHLGKTAYVVGEATTPAIRADDLLIIGSGSGRTASLVAAARKAKELGVAVLLVTIDAGSPMAALADCVVRIDAPSPKAAGAPGGARSMQPMGSLFEQTLFLLFDAMVVALMRSAGLTAEAMFALHANLE